jgi:hypothetical protein
LMRRMVWSLPRKMMRCCRRCICKALPATTRLYGVTGKADVFGCGGSIRQRWY